MLLQGLALHVMAFRQNMTVYGAQHQQPVQMVSFVNWREDLLHTDCMVSVCPLTDTMRYLVNANALSCLPQGTHLINVERG